MNPYQDFDNAASLALINRMIAQAKEDFADYSFQPLLWGWTVALAALTQYALLQRGYGAATGLVWAGVLPLTGVVSLAHGIRQGQQQGSIGQRSLINRVTGYLWGSIGAAFGITTALMFQPGLGGFQAGYVFFICLFGVGTLTTGGLIRFRPLQVGGGLCFLIATGALFVAGPALLLLLALALLVSYIVPGHLLRAESRRKRTEYEQAVGAPNYV